MNKINVPESDLSTLLLSSTATYHIPPLTASTSTSVTVTAADVSVVAVKGHSSMIAALTNRLSGMSSLAISSQNRYTNPNNDNNNKNSNSQRNHSNTTTGSSKYENQINKNTESMNIMRESSVVCRACLPLGVDSVSLLIGTAVNLFPHSAMVKADEEQRKFKQHEQRQQEVEVEVNSSQEQQQGETNATHLGNASVKDDPLPPTLPLPLSTLPPPILLPVHPLPVSLPFSTLPLPLIVLPLSVRLGALSHACHEVALTADSMIPTNADITYNPFGQISLSSSSNDDDCVDKDLKVLLMSVFNAYQCAGRIDLEEDFLIEAADVGERSLKDQESSSSSLTNSCNHSNSINKNNNSKSNSNSNSNGYSYNDNDNNLNYESYKRSRNNNNDNNSNNSNSNNNNNFNNNQNNNNYHSNSNNNNNFNNNQNNNNQNNNNNNNGDEMGQSDPYRHCSPFASQGEIRNGVIDCGDRNVNPGSDSGSDGDSGVLPSGRHSRLDDIIFEEAGGRGRERVRGMEEDVGIPMSRSSQKKTMSRGGRGNDWNNEWNLDSDSSNSDGSREMKSSSDGGDDSDDNHDVNRLNKNNNSDHNDNNYNDNRYSKSIIPRNIPYDLLSLSVRNLPRVIQECLDRFDLPCSSLTDLKEELDSARTGMVISSFV